MDKKIVGIHGGTNRTFTEYVAAYEVILAHNNIEYKRLYASDNDFWKEIKNIDYFIYQYRHSHSDAQVARSILPVIENYYNISCFPNQATCWHFDDKIKQYYLLKSQKFPVTESYIFWEKESALQWIEKADYPVVFKLKGGAGSSNVILISSIARARKIVNKMFSIKGVLPERIPDENNINFWRNISFYQIRRYLAYLRGRLNHEGIRPYWQTQRDYVLFQKFLPDNNHDTRVVVIGKRAFAFRRFIRDNDFRASGSRNNDLDPSQIDPRCLKIAFQVSLKMGFQSMAYDFMYNEKNEPEIIEISYSCPSRTILNCKGYWDINLRWNEGQYCPQFFQLQDLLDDGELKQPPIEKLIL